MKLNFYNSHKIKSSNPGTTKSFEFNNLEQNKLFHFGKSENDKMCGLQLEKSGNSNIIPLLLNVNSENIMDVISEYSPVNFVEIVVKELFKNKDISVDDKKGNLLTLKDIISQKASCTGVNLDATNEELEQIINNLTGDKKNVKVETQRLNQLFSTSIGYIIDRQKMEEAIEKRYLSENANTFLDDDEKEYIMKVANLMSAGSDVLGDGKIRPDNGARQLSGGCWAHAGINATSVSDIGQELLDNLIVKKNGIIAVKLPEAAKNNFPEPQGDGIYTFTEHEIENAAHSISIGDGDVTALLLATSKYFASTGENSDKQRNIDGNPNYRMFEILTGEKFKIFKNPQIPEGVSGTTFDYQRNPDKLYDNLVDLISNNKGAITTQFSEKLFSRHAYAVINMDKEFVYLKESNNPKNIQKITRQEFIENSVDICTYRFK